MQPYFFPYIGYFSLIKHVDKFIVSDEPQMINNGWIHRNRVLKPIEGWYYIRVPLIKYHHDTKIKNIQIRNTENWKSKIIDQLGHYKKKAAYYYNVISLIKNVFENTFLSIVELNVAALIATCNYLNIQFTYDILSELDIDLSAIKEAGDWGKCICHELGYTNYINPIGGKILYSPDDYRKEGIDASFIKHNLPPYDQKNDSFIEGLSIVDVMMFNSPEEINEMLDDYEIIG